MADDRVKRPILRGKDIKKYGFDWKGLYLINFHNGIPNKNVPALQIKDFPSLKNYFDLYYTKLAGRDDQGVTPYNLRSCAYLDEFSKPKILYSEIVQDARFYLDNNNKFFPEATAFSLTGENLDYLCVCLNSSFISWVFKTFYAGGGLGEHGYRYKKAFLLELPLPHNLLQIEQVRDTVNACYEEKTASDFDSKVNEIIYKQYGLSAEEISYIETNK